MVRLGLESRGGEFSRSSRSGGSGVRIAARPVITHRTQIGITATWLSTNRVLSPPVGDPSSHGARFLMTLYGVVLQYVPKLAL